MPKSSKHREDSHRLGMDGTGAGSERARAAIRVRQWSVNDIERVVTCHEAAYPEYREGEGFYGQRHYRLQLEAFPEGQFLAEADGQVVGYATSLILEIDDHLVYTYAEITGDGAFTPHRPTGDTLYGADIAVDPAYRGMGVAKQLYKARRRLLRRYNLRRMVAYGRIPGYAAEAGTMTAQEYVSQVVTGRRSDSSLSTHLNAGYRVKGVMSDLFDDGPSVNYCTLLEMPNPDFRPHRSIGPDR